MATETQRTSTRFPGVVAYFSVSDTKAATALYEKAFGAKLIDRQEVPDGRAVHCHLEVNGGPLMLNDAFPDHGHPLLPSQNFVLHISVDDPKAWWKRAVDAGLEIVVPLDVAFWGDMYGQLRDSFGQTWGIVGPASAG